MARRLPLSLVFIAALLRAPVVHGAERPPLRFELGAGAHYSTGDYGEDSDTDIVYVPVSGRAELGRWMARLTVPYLRIRGGSAAVEGPSGPVQTSGGTHDGLGDVLLEGSYTFEPWHPHMPFLELGGRIKFPTAEEGTLGTGEVDFTPELTAARRYGRFTPFLTFGYRVLGDPAGADLADGFLVSAGALYQILPPLDAGVFLLWRETSSRSSEDPLDLAPFVSWRIGRGWIGDAYVSAGLSDGSPHAGTGLQLRYRYDAPHPE